MSIGEKIRVIRKNQKLTVGELSERTGVPEKTIYRIETGEVQDPKLSSIKPIIKALNCSADDILFDDNEKDSKGIIKSYLDKINKLGVDEKILLISVITRFIHANEFIELQRKDLPLDIRIQIEADEGESNWQLAYLLREEEAKSRGPEYYEKWKNEEIEAKEQEYRGH